MSNSIRMYDGHKQADEWLSMTNVGTSTFLDVIVLSGSILAVKDREEELIVFLAEQDQSRRGLGTVGFDISEMPWSKDSFELDKKFMLNVIQGAFDKLGWETLNYEPSDDFVFHYLEKFKWLISNFKKYYIDWNYVDDWKNETKREFEKHDYVYPRCEKHEVLMSVYGCIVCNNK